MSSQTYSADATHVLYLDEHLAACLLLADAVRRGFEPGRPIIDLLVGWHSRENPLDDLRALGMAALGYDDADPDELVHYAAEDLDDAFNVIPGFDGTLKTVYPDKAKGIVGYEFDDATLYVVYPDGEPDLFKAPYSGPEEIVEEFQKKLKDALAGLSQEIVDAIDWWGLMVDVDGTAFS